MPTELSLVSRKERLQQIRLACQVKVKQDMAIRIPEEIFNIRKYQATVVSNDNVATFIKELVMKLDEGQQLNFEAGAYIQIDIPEYAAEFKDFSVAERYKAAWKQYNLLTPQSRHRPTCQSGPTPWPIRPRKPACSNSPSASPHHRRAKQSCPRGWVRRLCST